MYLLFLLLASAFLSYLPGFKVSYFGEDVLLHLPEAAGPFHLSQLWKLHAEHFIPLMKMMYRFCYQFFWLDPRPFHFILTVVLCLCVLMVHKLLFALTKSYKTSLLGAFLFGFSTLYDSAVVEMCNAQTLLCLLFTVSFLYSIEMYFSDHKKKWLFLGVSSGFFAPCTFAFGVLAGIWGGLYYFCCIPQERRRGLKKDAANLTRIFSGWFIGIILYGLHFKDVVYYGLAPETSIVNKAFHLSSLKMGIIALQNIWNPLIIRLYPLTIVSLLLFFLGFAALLIYPRKSLGKKALFFLVWIVLHYFVVGMTRHIPETIYVGARHNLFPALGLSCFYAVVLVPVFVALEKVKIRSFLVFSLIFAGVMFSSYNKAQWVNTHYPEGETWKEFYEGFRESVSRYPGENNAQKIHIEDKAVMFNSIFIFPLSVRTLSEFILPLELRDRIEWGGRTDEGFLKFLKEKSRYEVFLRALSGQQYFPL